MGTTKGTRRMSEMRKLAIEYKKKIIDLEKENAELKVKLDELRRFLILALTKEIGAKICTVLFWLK